MTFLYTINAGCSKPITRCSAGISRWISLSIHSKLLKIANWQIRRENTLNHRGYRKGQHSLRQMNSTRFLQMIRNPCLLSSMVWVVDHTRFTSATSWHPSLLMGHGKRVLSILGAVLKLRLPAVCYIMPVPRGMSVKPSNGFGRHFRIDHCLGSGFPSAQISSPM